MFLYYSFDSAHSHPGQSMLNYNSKLHINFVLGYQIIFVVSLSASDWSPSEKLYSGYQVPASCTVMLLIGLKIECNV
jgi:hypothetical protein